jgi:ribosomal protein S18 acetylase RimI-like enzyme
VTEVPALEIRACRDSDLAGVVDLWKACELLRPWNDPGADIALCRATPASEIFVAHGPRDNGETRLSAVIMCGSDGHRGWLYYLAVDPRQRRQGLARLMVAHAERWLADLGVRKVELMIRPENDAVKDFYERVGYEVEPRLVMSRWLEGHGERR